MTGMSLRLTLTPRPVALVVVPLVALAVFGVRHWPVLCNLERQTQTRANVAGPGLSTVAHLGHGLRTMRPELDGAFHAPSDAVRLADTQALGRAGAEMLQKVDELARIEPMDPFGHRHLENDRELPSALREAVWAALVAERAERAGCNQGTVGVAGADRVDAACRARGPADRQGIMAAVRRKARASEPERLVEVVRRLQGLLRQSDSRAGELAEEPAEIAAGNGDEPRFRPVVEAVAAYGFDDALAALRAVFVLPA